MSVCDNTTVNQETPLKLQSKRKTKHVAMLAKKLLMTLELDRVPRYFIKKKYRDTGTQYQVSTVPVTVLKSTVVL